MNLHRYHITLRHGTTIKLSRVGELSENRDGSGNLPIDYVFVERGRLSRRQINNALRRLLMANLVNSIHSKNPDHRLAQNHRARHQKWMENNIVRIRSVIDPD